jgi:hypothetical protein
MEGKSFNVGRRAGSPLSCCQLREEHSRETSRHFLEVAVAKTGTMAMTRRPIRFTPDNLLRVRQMAAEGNSSIQIAQSMGSTSASVKNVCCRHNIKIPRRRRSVENTLSPLVAHLPASLSTEFHRKAAQFKISASVLASRLLEAIVVSDIYDAVLDDKD